MLRVYEAALREYHFNVNLGWERTKFFLLLNSGLIAAGVGLVRFSEGSALTSAFLLLFFIMLIMLSISSLRTVNVAKQYYREAIFTKTVVERELGLLEKLGNLPDGRDNLSIAVTDGQRDFLTVLTAEKLQGSEENQETIVRKIFGLTHSITSATEAMFVFMALIAFFAAIVAVVNLVRAGMP